MLKKGMKVTVRLHGAGQVTEHEAVVAKVNKKGVWLDNGQGNDPNGPFVDGKKEGVFGFWEEIKEESKTSKYVDPYDDGNLEEG